MTLQTWQVVAIIAVWFGLLVLVFSLMWIAGDADERTAEMFEEEERKS